MTSNEGEARGYVRSITKLTEEIKNMTEVLSELRAEKKRAEDRLLQWMIRRDLYEFEGIKRSKIVPKKPRVKRKPKKQQVEDTMALFRDVGIPDPEEFYRELKNVQYANRENVED